MTAKRHARWAGVEFQPDLKNPTKPVKLGGVLYEVSPSGERSVVVVGRVPRLEHRPPEFEHVSAMTMELASDWVDAMLKDIMEAKPDDPIAHLASRWRWNLYVIEPVTRTLFSRVSLESAAKRFFARFVGEPFGGPRSRAPKVRARMPVVPGQETQQADLVLPPAWVIEQISRSIGPSLHV